MICLPTTRARRGGPSLGLGVLLLLLGGAPAQAQSIEERYQQAIQLFNTAQMEDACALLTQIEKEKPGYKQTRTYLNPACESARQAYAVEEKLFKEGVDLFNQGRYEDAQQKFEQANKIQVKNPKYRDQISRYLKDLEIRKGEERLFQEAVKLFNEGNDTEARNRFHQVVQIGGGKAAEARSYLQRLDERREESAFNEGVRSFNGGDLSTARTRFQEVVRLGGKKKADAERYLGQIDAAEREQRAFNDALRAFEGRRYNDAKNGFQQVVALNGSRKAEAERYLSRIDLIQREEAAFAEAKRKFDQKDLDGARAAFQKVIDLGGSLASEARAYLVRIEARGEDPRQLARQFVADARSAFERKQYAEAADKLRSAVVLDSTNAEARRLLSQAEELAIQQPLRNGLEAFFTGRYDDAERFFTSYLENRGSKRALALFFRGAVYSIRYFLSGENEEQQREKALVDFRATRESGPRFRSPDKYVSPKILALYTEAVGAGGP